MRYVAAITLLSLLCLAACELSGSNVSTRTQIAGLPVTPEGRWHDLEALTMGGGRKLVTVTFSRRFLLQDVIGENIPLRPIDPRDYRVYLNDLDRRLTVYEPELAAFSVEARRRLRSLLERGSTITSAPTPFGQTQYDDDANPVGPNRASMTVTWWPGGVKTGEPVEVEVFFLQEHEEWRIDGITPSLFAGEPDPIFGIPLAR